MSSTNGLGGEGATVPRFIDHKIFLKSVILLGVIVSLFAILAAENLLAHIIESDRSMLSIVILLIYLLLVYGTMDGLPLIKFSASQWEVVNYSISHSNNDRMLQKA